MTSNDLRSVNVLKEREEHEFPLRVYLRVRPLNKFELSRRSRHCIQVHQNDMEGTTRVTIDSPYEGPYDFSFDQIFDEHSTHQHIYASAAKPMIQKLTSGFNCALLLYGSSQSGKTHTLTGTRNHYNNVSKKQSDIMEDPTSVIQRQNTSDSAESIVTTKNDTSGIIQTFIREFFSSLTQTKDYSSSLETTVQCSYIEVYMEAVRDLLNPNQAYAHVVDSFSFGTRLAGVSKIRCRNEADALSLLNRGIALKTILEARKHSDAKHSHSIFTIYLQQKCTWSGRTITSHVHFVDLAANDSIHRPSHRAESNKIINNSALVLHSVVRALTNKAGTPVEIPYKQSILTRILQDALGGNCISSVICTVSPSSLIVDGTLACARFAEKCKEIRNNALKNLMFSPEEAMSLLRDKNHTEVTLSTRPIIEINSTTTTEDVDNLHSQLERMTQIKETMDNTILGLQSEISILRHENDCVSGEKKQALMDLVTAQSEIQELQRRKTEVETNLRTSQFRESEATVFLRQFRTFYRRLLQNKTSQGNGFSSQLFSTPPGVPGIQDMVDIDTLLWRSGLLEDDEVDSDGKMTSKYRPSAQALTRSSLAAAHQEAPSETLRSQDNVFLELELKAVVEKSCALHLALEESQSMIEILSNNSGSIAKLRLAEEALSLKKILEEKENDLQAIIWKMNELNLVNKTYDKKLSNLTEHMKYLSEALEGVQSEYRNAVESNRITNMKLQDEINHLSSLVSSLADPVSTLDQPNQNFPLPVESEFFTQTALDIIHMKDSVTTPYNVSTSSIHNDEQSIELYANIELENEENPYNHLDGQRLAIDNNPLSAMINEWSQYPEDNNTGAKPSSYVPIRFTTKFGSQIRFSTFQDYIQLVKC